MCERREVTNKYGVISILFDGYKIQVEDRTENGNRLNGFKIIPGGGMKDGESEAEALKREIREEYGVEITFFKKLGVAVDQIDQFTINHGNVYLITNWVGELVDVEKRNQHLEVSIDEAREICKHPVTQKILDLLDKELSR